MQLRSIALASLVLVSLGCEQSRSQNRSGLPQLPTDALLGQVSALAYLPAHTAAVAVVVRASQISARPLESGSTERSGVNLTWLGGLWPEIQASGLQAWLGQSAVVTGLAVDKPAGLAWIEVRSDTVVGFAAIAKPGQIQRALTQLASLSGWRHSRSGAGQIVSAAGAGVGVIERDGWLFVVTSGVASVRAAVEVRLASGSIHSPDSLLAQDRFRRAAEPIAAGAGAIYLDFEALAQPVLERIDDVEYAVAELVAEAAQALREGRQRSLPALEQRVLSDHYKRALARQRQTQAHTAVERRLVGELVAGWGQLSGSVKFTPSETALTLSAWPRTGTLARSLLHAARSSAPSEVGPSPPAQTEWRVHMATHPRALWSAGALIGQALWGLDLERSRAHLVASGGAPSDGELLGLSGELGLRMVPGTASVSATIGFRNGATAEGWFTRLAEQLGQASRTGTGDGSGHPGRVQLGTPNTQVEIVLSRANWTISVHQSKDATAPEPSPGAIIAPLPVDDNPDVPLSQGYRALVAEHAGLADRVQQQQQVIKAGTREHRQARYNSLGRIDVSLAADEARPIGEVQLQLGADDLSALLGLLATQAKESVERRERAEAAIVELQTRAVAIARELLQVRARDVQRWDLRE